MTSITAPAGQRPALVTTTRALTAFVGAFLVFASIMFGFVGAEGEDADPLAAVFLLPVGLAFLYGAARLEQAWALVAILAPLWTGFGIGKVVMGETHSLVLVALGAIVVLLLWNARVREHCGVRL